jgi:tetratricopeptide (TPR) repeat protein
MTGKRRGNLVASTLVLVVTCVAVLGLNGRGGLPKTYRRSQAVPVLDGSSVPEDRVPYDPELANKTVAFWAKQAERDPQGAIELRELAGAYLARFRETGDIADAVKAEEASRRSLEILPRNNSAALVPLTRSLLAQHRFPEALKVAEFAAQYDLRAGRLIADVRMELGDYDAAERALAAAPPVADDLNYYALRARLEEIRGKPDVALRLLRNAQRLADDRPDMPAEAVAWYHTMVGHAYIESGRLDEGERACQSALRIFPRDYRAMTGMAEAAAWRGDWHGVIDWAKKAVRFAPQNPVALKLIGNACTALGQDQEAARQYQLLKELTHSFPRIYDRHWALFCADHGRDLDEALALARKDLELRRDVHGYDALAWVCFQKGMLPEAERAMRKALAHGTREATLFYHAGMIARAGGDPVRAKDFFTRARDINPHSIPLRWLRWMNSIDG